MSETKLSSENDAIVVPEIDIIFTYSSHDEDDPKRINLLYSVNGVGHNLRLYKNESKPVPLEGARWMIENEYYFQVYYNADVLHMTLHDKAITPENITGEYNKYWSLELIDPSLLKNESGELVDEVDLSGIGKITNTQALYDNISCISFRDFVRDNSSVLTISQNWKNVKIFEHWEPFTEYHLKSYNKMVQSDNIWAYGDVFVDVDKLLKTGVETEPPLEEDENPVSEVQPPQSSEEEKPPSSEEEKQPDGTEKIKDVKKTLTSKRTRRKSG